MSATVYARGSVSNGGDAGYSLSLSVSIANAGAALVVITSIDVDQDDVTSLTWGPYPLRQVEFGEINLTRARAWAAYGLPAATYNLVMASDGSGGASRVMVAHEIVGLTSESALDVHLAEDGAGTSPLVTLGSATTADYDVLLAAVITEGAESQAAGSWVGEFTALTRKGGLSDGTAQNTIATAWRTAGVVGMYSAGKTDIDSANWIAMLLAFKTAAAAASLDAESALPLNGATEATTSPTPVTLQAYNDVAGTRLGPTPKLISPPRSGPSTGSAASVAATVDDPPDSGEAIDHIIIYIEGQHAPPFV